MIAECEASPSMAEEEEEYTSNLLNEEQKKT